MHLCLIHSHHPTSIISSQSPPSSPSFQPPKPSFQTATNDHRTRRRQPHRSAKTSYGCWGAGRSLPVPAAIWSGSQKPLVVVPPGQIGHASLTCDRQSERNTPEVEITAADDGRLGRQAGLSPDVLSPSARNDLTAFWWGSGPQMLLVQQPDS